MKFLEGFCQYGIGGEQRAATDYRLTVGVEMRFRNRAPCLALAALGGLEVASQDFG